MKFAIALLLISLLTCITVSKNIRLLQFSDPLCQKYNNDGTVCLQCAYRAYFDIVARKCVAVNSACNTWNLSNGQCLTCYDGYGNAEYNGSAIDGLCPRYDPNVKPLDPNCQTFDQNRTCTLCFQGYYLDMNDYCEALPPGCLNV